jgi:TldD protein
VAGEDDPREVAALHRVLAHAVFTRARERGVEHADLRVERIATWDASLRDGRPEGSRVTADSGICVRVLHRGSQGFAASSRRTPADAVALVDTAVGLADATRPMSRERVELAPEPVHLDQSWVSSFRIDPFAVPEPDRLALLAEFSRRLLAAPGVDHVQASVRAVREDTFYADTAGTSTTQRRVRIHPILQATAVDPRTGAFTTMRTLAPPVGRGWEYLYGDGWDWDTELAELPGFLAEKVAAPAVVPGVFDLVLDPSQLWLTIHESVGHATELDRALGYEANYAGTSFATPDLLGTFRYGSPAMTVTGDRTVEHGLATVGFDHEGVAAREFDLIRAGILVGFQTDRRTAALQGLGASTGCAFADSPAHLPIQRMANVSLAPDRAEDTSTASLISRVADGYYLVGDDSWSIDMQRFNFQFTGQRMFRIRDGELAGQVRDGAYQGSTPRFWRSLEAVGGPSTWVLGGAFDCGKAQPGQVAPVSHGCPSGLFRGVTILDTADR